MRLRTIVLAVFACCIVALPAAAQTATISYKSTQLTPGLYMLEGEGGFAGGNLGLLVGDDGVVLIDDGLPPLTEQLLGAIRKLSERPVRFLINTHAHGDHVGNNFALGKAGATIVAHDQLRQRMIDDGTATADGKVPTPKEALPVVTFSDAVTFHLNGRDAYVFHVAHAHTDGDAVIHFRKDNVIHTGDVLFNGLFPFIDLDSGGTVDGYIAAQRRILELADDQTRIIPGHGPLATRADLKQAVDMLEDARTRVQALVRAGRSLDEVVEANPLQDYHDGWNWGFITTERMTRTLYRGLTEK